MIGQVHIQIMTQKDQLFETDVHTWEWTTEAKLRGSYLLDLEQLFLDHFAKYRDV